MFEKDINIIAQKLNDGSLIMMLSETGWELACDASNEEAASKLMNLNFAGNIPSLQLYDQHQLYFFVEKVPELAWELMEYSEKSLTILYPKGKNVLKTLIDPDGYVAIRLVKDQHVKRMLNKFKKPLLSIAIPAKKIEDVRPEIVEHAGLIVCFDNMKTNASAFVKVGIDNEIKFL